MSVLNLFELGKKYQESIQTSNTGVLDTTNEFYINEYINNAIKKLNQNQQRPAENENENLTNLNNSHNLADIDLFPNDAMNENELNLNLDNNK